MVTSTPALPQAPNTGFAVLTHTQSANTLETVITGGAINANFTNVFALWATNTDSSNAYAVQIWVTRSSTNYLLGTVNVPASSGNTAAAPPVNLLSALPCQIDENGNPYLLLEHNDVLAFSATTQVAASQTLTCVGQGEDW